MGPSVLNPSELISCILIRKPLPVSRITAARVGLWGGGGGGEGVFGWMKKIK
jgi:hypothetical protein